MHEFGIADDVLAAATVEAGRVGGGTLLVVGVRLGTGSGIDPDALQSSFDALVAHRDLGPLSLEIETVSQRRRCICGEEFEVNGLITVCPVCGAFDSKLLGGGTLDIAFLEFSDEESAE